jgi:predicted ester cyclase
MSADGNAAIYRAHLDCVNNGDLAGYLDLYSDDVVFGGVSPEPMDKAAVVAFHEDFYAAFPGMRADVLELVESGDKLAARLLLSGGRHEREYLGVPPSGAEVQMPITTILTMRDGKCVERWSTADMLGLLIQVGAVPPPGA